MTADPQHWLLDIGRAEIHNSASVTSAGSALRCVTNPGRWSYCLSLPLSSEIRSAGAKLIVSIGAEIQRGVLGLRVVAEDHSTYLVEEQFSSGDADLSIVLPAAKAGQAYFIVLRNAAPNATSTEFTLTAAKVAISFIPAVTAKPFRPRANRNQPFELAGILTTETCNLSCVMCHFNGPKAIKKSGMLEPAQVEKVLANIPSGEAVWFGATGEFFIDPNALDYLRRATSLRLKPCVLTHGQMFTPELMDSVLDAGVRMIRMSVDSTDEAQYRKIRRGGELRNIIEACKYLRRKKVESYPDLRVEINATLFRNTFDRQKEMEDFWRGLVDQVIFNAEYYDTFSFRNVFFIPEKRVDCNIQLYVMPSGRIAPCCAIAVYQHDNDLTWLPHIDEVGSLEDAHERLCELYEDPHGPLTPICAQCDWWILSMSGNSPYIRAVDLSTSQNKEVARINAEN